MERYVAFTITKTIRQDYDRRDAFTEIHPGEPSYKKTWPNGELYWVTDYKLGLKLLEDADEQHSLRRNRSPAESGTLSPVAVVSFRERTT